MKIFVKVKTGASHEKIKEDGKSRFEVRTKKHPVEGKANRAVLKLPAGHFELSASKLRIASGVKSREKLIRVDED